MPKGGIYPIAHHPSLTSVTDSTSCCQCSGAVNPSVDLVVDTSVNDRFLHRESCLIDYLCTDEARELLSAGSLALVVPVLRERRVESVVRLVTSPTCPN